MVRGYSNRGKTHLKNYILFQKQESFFTITKSINQYPNKEAQTSDENRHEKNLS